MSAVLLVLAALPKPPESRQYLEGIWVVSVNRASTCAKSCGLAPESSHYSGEGRSLASPGGLVVCWWFLGGLLLVVVVVVVVLAVVVAMVVMVMVLMVVQKLFPFLEIYARMLVLSFLPRPSNDE